MAKTTLDAIVIGGGHNGLVAAALPREGRAGRLWCSSAREPAGGILATTQLAPGFTAPALVHTVGRLRASVVKDLKLDGHGLELIEPDGPGVRAAARRAGITFWADAGRTAAGFAALSAADADAYAAFDRKVRALASFLAYVNVATPPDIKCPSLADAIRRALKLGRAFRDLGAKAGREAIRALPMAVADFVAGGLRARGRRGPSRRAAILYTAMGPWAAGTAFVFLNDSAGNDGGAVGQTMFARGGPAALADALVQAAAGVRRARSAPAPRWPRSRSRDGRADRRAPGRGGEIAAARVIVSATDPKRTLLALCGPGGSWGPPGLARRQHPQPGHDGEGEPRAVGAAGGPTGGDARDAARAAS